ncbi:MAG TPA: S8 family peptidase [Bacteroidia bacterium]|nr:S8 family peptidase [Bacteroidia bacterium]
MKNTFRLLLIVFSFCSFNGFSQQQQQHRQNNNWFNTDPSDDRFAGVSSDKTYNILLMGLVPDTVIVAVLDGGTDVTHPDLAANIWVNPGEIAGNGIDDDNNGYVDDIHGWNFLGSKKGTVDHENIEITRQYRAYLSAKENKQAITPDMKKAAKVYPKELKKSQKLSSQFNKISAELAAIKKSAGSDSVRIDLVRNYQSNEKLFAKFKKLIITEMESGSSFEDISSQINAASSELNNEVNYHLNLDYTGRSIIGDDPSNYSDHNYGNNDVTGPEAEHGTHVAGIIGAVRDNDLGINGIAAPVKIMVVRVVPDGDEYDKDIANGIRYAVDNGAKVINMSFGKDLSPGKSAVDAAMEYAASKDVLIVHAAGNDSKNIDKGGNYPNPYLLTSGQRIPSWLEVGASSSSGDAARFSNYGRKTVDLFAPGVNIYSTVPDSSYVSENGTSMAAPMVSGVAAILRSYFPQLSADQVRNILLATVTKVPFDTTKPGTKKHAGYNELCATGGIVNAFKAVEMAKGIGK